MSRLVVLALSLTPFAAGQKAEAFRAVIDTPGGELPFSLVFISIPLPFLIENGDERIAIETERIEGGFRIGLPPYDSTMELREVEGARYSWAGTWTKAGARGPQVLPVRVDPWPLVVEGSRRTRGPQFPIEGPPLDVSGRWRVQFEQDPEPAVGVFEAHPDEPGEVRGTFLTTTGDYRYLTGTARGQDLALSVFDGAHAFLFRARLQPDGTLAGDFWSGATWHETWTAVRDEAAALPDAFGLNRLMPGVVLGDLEYPALDGEPRALKDSFGRATLVQLFGTWCPNCGDAGLLLRQLERDYSARGLKVIGLAFEHGDDVEVHRARVAAYREHRGGSWPVFLAGSSDKRAASAAFPVLDRVLAYPTTLFVDAEGVVRAVHTGFAGPATGADHEDLVAAFRARIERLLLDGGR